MELTEPIFDKQTLKFDWGNDPCPLEAAAYLRRYSNGDEYESDGSYIVVIVQPDAWHGFEEEWVPGTANEDQPGDFYWEQDFVSGPVSRTVAGRQADWEQAKTAKKMRITAIEVEVYTARKEELCHTIKSYTGHNDQELMVATGRTAMDYIVGRTIQPMIEQLLRSKIDDAPQHAKYTPIAIARLQQMWQLCKEVQRNLRTTTRIEGVCEWCGAKKLVSQDPVACPECKME